MVTCGTGDKLSGHRGGGSSVQSVDKFSKPTWQPETRLDPTRASPARVRLAATRLVTREAELDSTRAKGGGSPSLKWH